MAIDIRTINEITFTQSFRGYNTEEVDDFLDDLYDNAIANNKEIEELKKKIAELESGSNNNESSSEDNYNVIANAQEEADKIIDAARRKAHSLIESAEAMQNEKPMHAVATAGISSDTSDKLKALFSEMYKKQMAILEDVEVVEEPKVRYEEKASDIPSISFAGLKQDIPRKMPAERDILGEINSIELGGFKESTSLYEVGSPYQEAPIEIQEEVLEEVEEEVSDGLAFSFAEPEAKPINRVEPSISFSESATEDPDDIIAQILRDNNRN